MEVIKVLLDNDAANRIAELDEGIAQKSGKSNTPDPTYIEDRDYLRKIVECLEKRGIVQLYYNPLGQREAQDTKEEWKRRAVLREYEERYFTEYHSTIFPILLSDDNPARFLTLEQKRMLDEIFNELPKKYQHDIKIVAEALFNPKIKFKYLLTCNTRHLAANKLRNKIKEKGLELKICTPRELYGEISIRSP